MSAEVHTIPLNADVATAAARLAVEIPDLVAWAAANAGGTPLPYTRAIPTQLRHLAIHYERLIDRGRTRDAHRIATTVTGWHHEIRAALGLNRPDRPIGAHGPLHDDPLSTLVEPGDRGWLRYDRLDHAGHPIDPRVAWQRTEVLTCRHCGAIWAPSRYMFLGRLIKDADRRRVGPDQPEGEAA